MKPVVGFAGMTHLGLVSGASVAAQGFRTICYDRDIELVAQLSHGSLPIVEPRLPELLIANGPLQVFTDRIGDLGQCDVIYISLDVPTNDEGGSDLSGINATIERVVAVIKSDAILVILCQVPPGFTRGLRGVAPARLYYQVETLVFGRAVERALHPERTIVGCADPDKQLPAQYAALLGAFGCPILPMRYESAELAKISINMCLVASIGVANTLAELCEAIGADWAEIAPALKLDKRIGAFSYLTPGLGIAGGNLERDLATVIRLADAHDTDAGIVRAWIANSRHRRDWAGRTIQRVLLDAKPDATIAVWGLAYKENTHSVKNSPSLATLARLPTSVRLRVHDPVVPAAAIDRPDVIGVADPMAALDGADALMILTPWPEYRTKAAADIVTRLSGKIVLDPYAVIDAREATVTGIGYYTLGRPAPVTEGGAHAAT